jgi:CubicO group peptidase (beta-lactamase class C family)
VTFDPARLSRIDTHFRSYVDDGRLPGWQILVSQHGQVAHASTYGCTDVAAGTPVQDDTLWRIYSMTKPLTSVLAMMLWEEGRFDLVDPISRWLPAFGSPRVYDKGPATAPWTVPATEPIRMWHLLTHTAGFTYGFSHEHPVDALYRSAGFEWEWPPGDLAAICDVIAELPLRFQPGTRWGYGVNTDVLGRVLEVISGKPLDVLLKERILDPLGMTDTRWWVEGADVSRLAPLYARVQGRTVRHDALGDAALQPPKVLSGGGGLVSTAADYHRFQRMLLGRGHVDGVRLLAPRTVEMMSSNHLPGGADLAELSVGGFAETSFEGIGFGLGFAVVLDPHASHSASSVGEHYWGGAASTAFWVDRSTGVSASFYTQLLPSSTFPIRAQLRALVYAALVD